MYERGIVYYGQIMSDHDILKIESYVQKAFGKALEDILGATSTIYTGLAITPTGGSAPMTVTGAKGRVYADIATEATPMGSQPQGLPTDSTPLLKQGVWAGGQLAQVYVSPGSGSNFYLLQATLVEADVNPSTTSFTDITGVRLPDQVLNADRIVNIVFSTKLSTSSTPSADSGNVAIAAITIPSGVTSITSGMISQFPAFTGFAGLPPPSTGFVVLNPGSQQSGFINISGNYQTNGAILFQANASALLSSAVAIHSANPAFKMQGANRDITDGADNADYVQVLDKNNVVVFKVPNTGIIPVAFGGTGTATPGIVAGTGITVSGTWPNQTVAVNPAYILPVAQGGTGTATPTLTGIGGIQISGSWPDQVVAFSPGLPVPVAYGGTGTATPSIVAGYGISVTGAWPNQTIALLFTLPLSIANGGTGTATPALVAGKGIGITGTWPDNTITLEGIVVASGSSPNNFTSPYVVSITLPGTSGETFALFLEWNAVGNFSGSNDFSVALASGTVTGLTIYDDGPGPGAGITGSYRALVCNAHGGQTVSFDLIRTAPAFLGIWKIVAYRTV